MQPFTHEAVYTHKSKEPMSIFTAGYIYHIDEAIDNSDEHKQLVAEGYTRLGIYKVDDAFINRTYGEVEL